jgi:hypothetical protein
MAKNILRLDMDQNRDSCVMNEQWVKWEPIKGLSANYYVDSISDNMKGFKIVLSEAKNENKKIHIIFKDAVYAYRSTEEGFRLDMLYYLKAQYGAKFYSEWSFFKITDSAYLKWLSEQSYGITDRLNFTHFCIFTMNFVLDIIAAYEPIVKIIENK